MESKKERVLAYGMAKIIGQEELAAVSGGGAHYSNRMTAGGSGGSGQGGEAHIDVVVDVDL